MKTQTMKKTHSTKRYYFHGDYNHEGFVFNAFVGTFVTESEFLSFDDFRNWRYKLKPDFRRVLQTRYESHLDRLAQYRGFYKSWLATETNAHRPKNARNILKMSELFN